MILLNLAFEGKDVAEVGGIARRKFVVFSKRLGIRLQKLGCHFYRWLAMLAIDMVNSTLQAFVSFTRTVIKKCLLSIGSRRDIHQHNPRFLIWCWSPMTTESSQHVLSKFRRDISRHRKRNGLMNDLHIRFSKSRCMGIESDLLAK